MGAEQSVKKSKRTAILSSSEMEQIKVSPLSGPIVSRAL